MDGSAILRRLGTRRHILLLQGPVGPFFDRLGRFLLACGCEVAKVNFNGGDEWFYSQPGALRFRDSPDHWPTFFDALLDEFEIDAVLLFGDCRPYHRSAILRARLRGVSVFVFEEGYIRPNYVTFEAEGVNGHSPLFRSRAAKALMLATALAVEDKRHGPKPPARPFSRVMLYAAAYYLIGRLHCKHFPDYRHHKPFGIYPEGWYWVRAGWRKLAYRIKERGIEPWLVGPMRKRFFLVPLQVFNDSQIRHHSDFNGIRPFITTVLESFARHAPKDVHLVFKHHPMDRGHRDYSTQIARQARHLALNGRAHYVHDLHLPTLLRAAIGTVVINSTVGLSSLFHGTPLKVLGRAIYDLPQLTFAGPLEAFWHNPRPPQPRLVRRLRNYLIRNTQVGGSFYSGKNIEVSSPNAKR